MKLRDSFGDTSRFEGDRALRWRSIPVGSRIVSASVTVTPLESNIGIAFGELLSLDGGAGDFGATKTAAVGSTAAWVEVDFHSRRTLARATGTFNLTTLQVDVGGGTYVQINKFGAFKSPDDDAPEKLFQLTGSSSPLPGLTVTKVKLTNETTVAPGLDTLTIISVPSNVSVRVGELPPFWTHVGEMTTPETTPDFAAVLEAALTTAKVENGFYDLPIIVHSDTIARLQIDLEVEFLVEAKPLPDGLPEVVLPFDFGSVTQATARIDLAVPPNTRVVASQTSARVKGAFAETRIAHGPTGAVKPIAAVEVSPACAQAQSVDELKDDVAVTAVDLLVEATTPAARLRLDIRGDLDGKPDDVSLMAGPAEFSIDKLAVTKLAVAGPRWISVPLPAEFVLAKSDIGGGKKKRYWLVLHSVVGNALWSAGQGTTLNMHCTRDGGLSWRDSIAQPGTVTDKSVSSAGPFTAFFRLRDKPKTFKVPIKLQVGDDENSVTVPLDKFQPLGRVDFALDTEVAQGINDYLGKTSAAACPETEHLINPEFEVWQRVDDNRSIQPAIRIGANIRDIAFSPDGALAYVLDQAAKKFLVVIDAVCGQVQQQIPLTFDPRAFALSPDGTRAYVTNGIRIEVVDLTTNQSLPGVFDLQLNASAEDSVNDLAVSPDGARLYAVTLITDVQRENAIYFIDTAGLENELTGGNKNPATKSVKKFGADPEQINSPVALAVSPDGALLYVAIERDDVDGMVKVINTTTFVPTLADIPVVGSPTDIGLTRDGVRAVVSNEGDANTGNTTVIQTATGTSTTIDLGAPGVGVAVSPDGNLAYVLKSDNSVRVIDIARGLAVDNFSVLAGTVTNTPIPAALAISPTGDQLYTGHNDDVGNHFVSPVQFGTRRPAEWQLTSGVVSPFCLPPEFHLTAILGPDTRPSAMSQVTPVNQSCNYEFSFQAIASDSAADEPPAVAEVIWLSSDCGSVGSEKVEITLLEATPVFSAGTSPGSALFAAGTAVSMALHRKRLTPPPGADQAEIRFTVPSDAAAAIDQVSFLATSEASANSDFSLQENGRLKDWTLAPAVAPGFAVLSVDDGIQLRNAGAATVELVQTVPAQAGQPFTVEIVGKTGFGASSQENQRVEVRWLNAESAPTGSPAVIEILADGLSSSVGRGTAPDDATRAEIHLIVPGRTTLVVERVSLRFSKQATVPLTFIAEAPGELTVSDVRVAFEQVEPKAPPVPDRGLCIPTPPGCEPGDASEDSCFCHKCESEQVIVEKKAVLTSAARPGVSGDCATCGTKLLRSGGPLVAGAQPFFSNVAPSTVTQPLLIRSTTTRTSIVRNSEPSVSIALTELNGIGVARARQLAEIGIDSVEKLASSTPEAVAQIKFITLAMATLLVNQAKTATRGTG